MLKAGVLGTIAGVVATAIVLLLGDAISGPLMTTSPGGSSEEVVLGAAMGATAFFGVVGIAVAGLCKRYLDNAATAFAALSALAIVGLGATAFAFSDTVATGVWLNVSHLAAAIPMVGLIAKELPNAGTRPAGVFA